MRTLRTLFRRKVNGSEKSRNPICGELSRNPICREFYTRKTEENGAGIKVTRDYQSFLKELKDRSILDLSGTYVLPGAQTTVEPSESESYINLRVRSTNLDEIRCPYYGLERSLAEVMKAYNFHLKYVD